MACAGVAPAAAGGGEAHPAQPRTGGVNPSPAKLQEAVLKIKRKAFQSTPGGRLEQAAPESKTLLDLAFAQGESAGAQTAQLMKLLEQYGATASSHPRSTATRHSTCIFRGFPAAPATSLYT